LRRLLTDLPFFSDFRATTDDCRLLAGSSSSSALVLSEFRSRCSPAPRLKSFLRIRPRLAFPSQRPQSRSPELRVLNVASSPCASDLSLGRPSPSVLLPPYIFRNRRRSKRRSVLAVKDIPTSSCSFCTGSCDRRRVPEHSRCFYNSASHPHPLFFSGNSSASVGIGMGSAFCSVLSIPFCPLVRSPAPPLLTWFSHGVNFQLPAHDLRPFLPVNRSLSQSSILQSYASNWFRVQIGFFFFDLTEIHPLCPVPYLAPSTSPFPLTSFSRFSLFSIDRRDNRK